MIASVYRGQPPVHRRQRRQWPVPARKEIPVNAVTQELLDLFSHPDYRTVVRSAGTYRFPANYRYESHSHRDVEINYVCSGSCIIRVNGQIVPLRQGDCILISPFQEHLFLTALEHTCSLTQMVCTVSMPASVLTQVSVLAFAQPFCVLPHSESLSLILEQISRYFRTAARSPYTQTLLDLSLLQFYTAFSQKMLEERQEKIPQNGKLGLAIRLMEEHLASPLNLEQLARETGVSSRYLRREFQHKMGMSCSAFLTALRISKAKELLWNTGKSIGEIASLTGFSSSQYFCRIFKKMTEMTPLDYRNLWNGGQTEKQV